MPVKIMRWKKHASMKNYAPSLNIVDLKLRKETVKWNEKLQTLYGRIRAMLNDAGVEKDFLERLWAECASTAAYYENLIVDKESNKDPNNLLFNQLLKKPVKLRKFREMCHHNKRQDSIKDGRQTVCLL
jgi:Asp-tRNA(Asn)/Glu-tRNA(Gln) amidotransferase B subunit